MKIHLSLVPALMVHCALAGCSPEDRAYGELGDAGAGAAVDGSATDAGDGSLSDAGRSDAQPDSGMDSGAMTDAAQPDVTSPYVESIVPAKQSVGVSKTTDVVLTFSEPMNQASTESALESDLPASTLSWNSEGTVLTITPDAPLASQSYEVVLTTAAQDLAGNNLSAEYRASFSTLNRHTVTFEAGQYDVASVDDSGGYSGYRAAGDDASNEQWKFIVSFDISTLPADIETFESATFEAVQRVKDPEDPTSLYQGNPFDLGNLALEHIGVGVVEGTNPAYTPRKGYTAETLHELGVLSSDATPGVRSLSVLVALEDDYENRVARDNQSSFRGAFATKSNYDQTQDLIDFEVPFTLTVQYLAP